MKGGYGWFSGLENTVMQVIDILFYKRSFYVLFPHAFVFTERKTETITQTKFSMQYLLLASFLKVFSHVHLAINIDFTIPQLCTYHSNSYHDMYAITETIKTPIQY